MSDSARQTENEEPHPAWPALTTTPSMRGTLIVVALILVVGLAGCTGISGDDGSNATPDGDTPTVAEPTDPGSNGLDGPHPYMENDTLALESMMAGHLETLGEREQFVLTNTVTVRDGANESNHTQVILEKRFDFAAERLHIRQRQEGPNAGENPVDLYRNATTQCSRQSGSVQCRESQFDPNRALGRVVEITALETVGAPAFSPNGTTTVNGEAVYRFSATELRDDPPEQSISELGVDPTIHAATLFVSSEGHVVGYDVTATVESNGDRVEVVRSYRITSIDGLSITPPEWVPS